MKKLFYVLLILLCCYINSANAFFKLKVDGSDHYLYIDSSNEMSICGGAPKVIISGDNGTYSYVLFDGSNPPYDIAVQVQGASNTFENCTFYASGGIALDVDEDCTVTNCILEGNTQDIDIATGKTVTAKNNCLHHSTDATNNIGAGTYTDANSVYAQDPAFWDASGSDFRLTAVSPCRDAAFNTGADTDLYGVVTPQYGIHDIGSGEYPRRSSGPMTMSLGVSGYCPHRRDD